MRFTDYIRDKIMVILGSLTGLLVLSFYLLAVGNQAPTVFFIAAVWIFVQSVYIGVSYARRKKYFDNLIHQALALDQPYLIAECMEKSWRREDQLYREILRLSNKGVIEHIHQAEKEQKEYKEFIEAWVHEVKVPLTGLNLLAHTLDGEARKRLDEYSQRLENYVDQALYYARSDTVYQDYLIRDTKLQDVITTLLKKNKNLLLENHMSAEVDCEGSVVPTDEKWLSFIMGQILINAVKYRRDISTHTDLPKITFRTEAMAHGVKLFIRDNGIGISDDEVDRIFEKGFTGTNGRRVVNKDSISENGRQLDVNRHLQATGIGLYLCKKLCDKLGLTIEASSKENEFTEILIKFPKNSFLSKL